MKTVWTILTIISILAALAFMAFFALDNNIDEGFSQFLRSAPRLRNDSMLWIGGFVASLMFGGACFASRRRLVKKEG